MRHSGRGPRYRAHRGTPNTGCESFALQGDCADLGRRQRPPGRSSVASIAPGLPTTQLLQRCASGGVARCSPRATTPLRGRHPSQAFNAYFQSYLGPDQRFDPGAHGSRTRRVSQPRRSFSRRSRHTRHAAERSRAASRPGRFCAASIRSARSTPSWTRRISSGLPGGPSRFTTWCGRSSIFGAYGRVNDAIRVGESATLRSCRWIPSGVPRRSSWRPATSPWQAIDLEPQFEDHLNEWLYESCAIAGQRRVRVKAIYMGPANPTLPPATMRAQDVLKECVRRAGGDPEGDVYLTPTAHALASAFTDIFTIRRNLRFLTRGHRDMAQSIRHRRGATPAPAPDHTRTSGGFRARRRRLPAVSKRSCRGITSGCSRRSTRRPPPP